jgi:transcriptional regulator with XRE-family HTH domain
MFERGRVFERHLKVRSQNIVGTQIRRLRYNRGWSQAHLAIQLQLEGLDIAREVIAQIEGQTHCVKDKHLPYFASVFRIPLVELFPHFAPNKPIHDTMTRLLGEDEAEAAPKVVTKSLQPSSAKAAKPELTI